QVRNQVMPPFQLHINVGPRRISPHPQLHQAVVHSNQQEGDHYQNAEENPGHELLLEERICRTVGIKWTVTYAVTTCNCLKVQATQFALPAFSPWATLIRHSFTA